MTRMRDATGSEHDGVATFAPLEGRRICLVFDFSLANYSRLLLEIAALQKAGANVRLLTSHPAPAAPSGVEVVYAPPGPSWERVQSIGRTGLEGSVLSRPTSFARKVVLAALERTTSRLGSVRYARKLQVIARSVDCFWVIDFPRLGPVRRAAWKTQARVVYETVDLVPEYLYRGMRHRQKCLDEERRLIGGVDGFITACESYADYYAETYGSGLRRRPMVRDNMPPEIATNIVATSMPLRLLFLGSLMSDRPIVELIEAIAATTSDVTLAFQGTNYLNENAARRVADRIVELGLGGRVELLAPSPPSSIVAAASAYDVGVVALRGVDENERRASTGKLFTYMAAGLAVLGSDLPGIARVVQAHGNGLLVDGMDPRAWADAIDRLASMPTEAIDSMKERSLSAANLYAWENQEPAYIAEFVRALSSQSNRSRG